MPLWPAASIAAAVAHAWISAPQLGRPHALSLAPLAAVTSFNPVRAASRARGVYLLNRLLLEPSECEVVHDAREGDQQEGRLVAKLRADDPRTVHVREKLRAESGQQIRAGVIDGGATDSARLNWARDSGGEAESEELVVELGSVGLLQPIKECERSRIDLLLAMPRPLQFARMLPAIASMGIGTLYVTGAKRIEKAYFASHLLREDRQHELRSALVEGLVQSGDTAMPRVVVCRGLTRLVTRGEISPECASKPLLRLACHPQRGHNQDEETLAEASLPRIPPLRTLREALADLPSDTRVLLAVGPERGWEEEDPSELDMLVANGFELVTLGPRTLRTDVAAMSLLAVAHDCIAAAEANQKEGI